MATAHERIWKIRVFVSLKPSLSFTVPLSRRAQTVLGAALCILAAVLVVLRPQWLSLPLALLSAGIFIVGLVPGVLFLGSRAPRPIPFLPLMGLYYAVFWGFSVFLVRHETWWPPGYGNAVASVSAPVLATILGGVTLMLLFFQIGRLSLCRRIPTIKLPATYPDAGLVVLLWTLLLGHLAYFFVQPLHQVPSIGQFLQPVGYLSYGMFYILWRERRIPQWQSIIVFLFLFPAEIVGMFLEGLLTPVVLIIIFMYCIQLYATGKIRIQPFILVPVLIVGTYHFLPTYRQLTWMQQPETVIGTLEKLDKLQYSVRKSVGEIFDWPTPNPHATFKGRAVNPVIQRISDTVKFAYIFEKTPGEVPYWKGATYKPLLTSFMPRALWPGKPEERLGQEFGHRYGVLQPADTITSENVPWITEFYGNFGIAGVLLGMSLVGLLLAALEKLFNSQQMTSLEVVTGATILFPLFYQESNFSLMTGSILPLTVSLLIFFHGGLRLFAWFERRWRRRGSMPSRNGLM